VYHYRVSEKMRIGELLLLQERIDPWLLSHTLKEQARTRQRLVSLLVGRAQLDPDDGALVLSEQLGYPAAMQRHLERRDPAVLDLLPQQLGARWVVLPLAEARTGSIVVVARDPTPILAAALEHAMQRSVVLSVTPSVQLERLVRAAYGLAPAPDEEPLPDQPPTLSDIGSVRLEDETPLPIRRSRTVSYAFKELPELPVRAPSPIAPIETTLEQIDRAITPAAVEHLVMSYATKRWKSALLARIDGARAVGARGHGAVLGAAEDLTIPLAPISTLSLAHEMRQIVSEQPPTVPQQLLRDRLGAVSVAAPVIAAGTVVAVIVVGEIIGAPPDLAIAELDRLVDALGAAYDRFSR
jgi:hypothetical protein